MTERVLLHASLHSRLHPQCVQSGAVVDRLEGADAPALTSKVAALAGAPAALQPPAAGPPPLNERLNALLSSAPVVLFSAWARSLGVVFRETRCLTLCAPPQ